MMNFSIGDMLFQLIVLLTFIALMVLFMMFIVRLTRPSDQHSENRQIFNKRDEISKKSDKI